MSDGPKKIAEIADILGIPESDCRAIAKEFEELFTTKKIGRIAVYDDNAVDRFRKIADLKSQGLPPAVIAVAIRGGRSIEELAREDMIKMGISNEKNSFSVAHPKLKQTPRSETEEKLILAIRSLEKKVATMDHRFAAIRETNETSMDKILVAVGNVTAEIHSLKEQMYKLWDQIASLENYLQEQSHKPFWKR